MIIAQGTNIPIVLTFDVTANSYRDIICTLWIQGKRVKRWQKKNGDIEISGTDATLPLDEDETRKFKKGTAKLLVKGLNSFNEIIFYDEVLIEILNRDDRDEDLIN